VIHHTLLISRGQQIEASDFQFSSLGVLSSLNEGDVAAADGLHAPAEQRTADSASPLQALKKALTRLYDENPPDLWQDIEAAVFSTAYDYCDRNQLQTSRLLNLSRNIVRARLAQLGILKLQAADSI